MGLMDKIKKYQPIITSGLTAATGLGILGIGLREHNKIRKYEQELKNLYKLYAKLPNMSPTNIKKLTKDILQDDQKNTTIYNNVEDVKKDKTLMKTLDGYNVDVNNPAQSAALMFGAAITDGKRHWVLTPKQTKWPTLSHELGHLKSWIDTKSSDKPTPKFLEILVRPLFEKGTLKDELAANDIANKYLKFNKNRKLLDLATKTYEKAHAKKRRTFANLFGGALVSAGVLKGIHDAYQLSKKGSMEKIALELKKHQERTVNKFQKSTGGIIPIHGVGTGKTITSIASILKHKGPVEVITPAPLVDNYKKELIKHVGKLPKNVRIRSMQRVQRTPNFKDKSMVVIDEAHRLRNPNSKLYQALWKNKNKFQKVMPMTASPIYNDPTNLASIVNLVKKKEVLPFDQKTFKNKFIKTETKNPGLLRRLFLGSKPGKQSKMINKRLFRSLVKGTADIHFNNSTSDFPSTKEEVHKVPMGEQQQYAYDYAAKRLPKFLIKKIKNNMPIHKQEAAKINAFLTATRQISNTPVGYKKGITIDNGGEHSNKLKSMLKHLKSSMNSNKKHKAVVYSNFINTGLKPYAHLLKKNRIKYEMFTGAESKDRKANIVKKYNTGKLPVLLISSSGTEGLDLKGTRQIQVMEPHFNTEKIKQVIGRGVRYKSHEHLPKSDRTVKVQHYLSVPHKAKSIKGRVISWLSKHKSPQVDPYLFNNSRNKEKLNNMFLKQVQKANKPSLLSRILGRK